MSKLPRVPVVVHVTEKQRALLARAAEAKGKSLEDFMRDQAVLSAVTRAGRPDGRNRRRRG